MKATNKTGAGAASRAATAGPAARIDARIAELSDWRGKTLARMRKLILQADPAITEEWKWEKPRGGGVPVWSRNGIICTGETYKSVVKLTFHKGASLPDPGRLFNASLEGNARRAIDVREGEQVDGRAFKALIKAAVAANTAGSKITKAAARASSTPANSGATRSKNVALLSGGNPQIAKGDGDAPVQAYIAAMPEWKRDLGKRLDAIITRTVPKARKAVKWNSPFYGIEGKGWFLSLHVFTRYVKVTFFAGASLRPVPPGAGKDKDARWIDIQKGELDEAQMTKWVRQAAALPGWDPGRKS